MDLASPIICVVTRARGATGSGERRVLLSRLRQMAQAGASMIQVRERHLDDRSLLRFVEELLETAAGTSCKVLVNERIDIALAARAHGVHLKSDSIAVQEVRTLVPSGLVVGRSVHSDGEAVAVERAGGCDYLFFGTVFPSSSKPDHHSVAGVTALEQVCGRVSMPVIAIGGINPARALDAARAGAAGVAAISLFAEAADPAGLVSTMRNALTAHQRRV
jgi:thiamine-phosphate diphosphorylase